ncbi:MAG: hypothetical protein RLZZ618_1094 [Pseudomonadota bacterium]|jgi:nitronate monooxygenase
MSISGFLGSRLPLIQAPMAGSQNSRLAIAVCRAGGLGSLPCAMLSPQALHAELTLMAEGTDQPYNVNFFAHQTPAADPAREAAWQALFAPYHQAFGIAPPAAGAGVARLPFSAEYADVLARFKPRVVSFHFGLPSAALIERVKRWGATVLSSATTVEEARWLEAHGADAVIAQGLEAGGHRGHFLSHDLGRQCGTIALLPQIIDSVRLPVIAAGGLADARGVRAAMALGATAVQVGTAYLLCHEATTSAVHRRALQEAESGDTRLTNVFTGRPARGIINRLMRELGTLNDAAPAFPSTSSALAALRPHAEASGSSDFSPLWAGQQFAACQATDAASITRLLAEGL